MIIHFVFVNNKGFLSFHPKLGVILFTISILNFFAKFPFLVCKEHDKNNNEFFFKQIIKKITSYKLQAFKHSNIYLIVFYASSSLDSKFFSLFFIKFKASCF